MDYKGSSQFEEKTYSSISKFIQNAAVGGNSDNLEEEKNSDIEGENKKPEPAKEEEIEDNFECNENPEYNYWKDNCLEIIDKIHQLKMELLELVSKISVNEQIITEIQNTILELNRLLNNNENQSFISQEESIMPLKTLFFKDLMIIFNLNNPELFKNQIFELLYEEVKDFVHADNHWSLIILEQLFLPFEEKSKWKLMYDDLLLKLLREGLKESKYELGLKKNNNENSKYDTLFLNIFNQFYNIQEKAKNDHNLMEA